MILSIDFEVISDLLWKTANLGDLIRGLVGLASLYGVYTFIMNHTRKTIQLSIGSFKIKRKYVRAQELTNIVSRLFYHGGRIPDKIRDEIIEITMPKVKDIKKSENKMNSTLRGNEEMS